jgi:hypothetical protein
MFRPDHQEIVMATKKTARKVAPKPAAGKQTASAPGNAAARKKAVAARPAKTGAVGSTAKKTKTYTGSCHCGRIAYEVDGTIEQVMDCNCSFCQRRGALLWFVPRSALRLRTPEGDLSTYTFNRHVLKHHFCARCGIAPFSEGENKGARMAAINARCLDGVELSKLKVVKYDGRKI